MRFEEPHFIFCVGWLLLIIATVFLVGATYLEPEWITWGIIMLGISISLIILGISILYYRS